MRFFNKMYVVAGLMLICSASFSQVERKGVVLDKKTGEGVPGVFISPKGMNYSTISNFEGKFLIITTDSTKEVSVEAEEYETLVFNVDTARDLTLTLTPLSVRNVFIGVGSGFNNISGNVGLRGEVHIAKGVSITAGAGLSAWAYRLSARVNYYFRPEPIHGYLFAGFSYSTGTFDKENDYIDEVERTIQLENNEKAFVRARDTVSLRLKPMQTIDVGYGYSYRVGPRNKVVVEIGYSFPLQVANFDVTFKEKPGTNPTISTVAEDNIRLSSPGGVCLGVGFLFGL